VLLCAIICYLRPCWYSSNEHVVRTWW